MTGGTAGQYCQDGLVSFQPRPAQKQIVVACANFGALGWFFGKTIRGCSAPRSLALAPACPFLGA